MTAAAFSPWQSRFSRQLDCLVTQTQKKRRPSLCAALPFSPALEPCFHQKDSEATADLH